MTALAVTTNNHPTSRRRVRTATPTKPATQARRHAKAQPKAKLDARLEARVPTAVMALVKHAASLQQRSVTEFVVQHLNAAAQQVLHDQAFFSVKAADFKAFEAIMCAPMRENKALQKLLSSRSPWEK